MKITFEGQSHQIDSNTLINTLIHYNTIIAEANKELSGGARNVQVNITALKEGSFEVVVSLAETFNGLFSGETMSYLSNIVGVTGGVFATYKALKGRVAKKKDIEELSPEIKIEGNVTIQNITNVYNNRIVREAVSKSIETANEDVNVAGIKISGDKLTPVEFNKSEFSEMIYTDFDTETERPEEMDEFVDTELVITGLKFEKGGKWEFIYNGFKIGMVVKDDALMAEINNGARFGKGDAVKVKLKIIKRYNSTYRTYENKGYKIVEFYEHIINPMPKQDRLFD